MMSAAEREAWETLTRAWGDVCTSIAPLREYSDPVEIADLSLRAWQQVTAIPRGLLPTDAVDRFLVLCMWSIIVVHCTRLESAVASAIDDRRRQFLGCALDELEERASVMRESEDAQRAYELYRDFPHVAGRRVGQA